MYTLREKPTSFFGADNAVWMSAKHFASYHFRVDECGSDMARGAQVPFYQAECHIGGQRFKGSPALTQESARQAAANRALQSIRRLFQKRPSEGYVVSQFREQEKPQSEIKKINRVVRHMQQHVREFAKRTALMRAICAEERPTQSMQCKLKNYLKDRLLPTNLNFDVQGRSVKGAEENDGQSEFTVIFHVNGQAFRSTACNSRSKAVEDAVRTALENFSCAREFPFSSERYFELVAWAKRQSTVPRVLFRVIQDGPRRSTLHIGGNLYKAQKASYTAACVLGNTTYLGVSVRNISAALEMAVRTALWVLQVSSKPELAHKF